MDEYKFYSYVDDKSILVITSKNKLVRIKCPFAVIGSDKKIFQVDAIMSRDNNIYFKIAGKIESHHKFLILIK